MVSIKISRSLELKSLPPENNLGFGNYFTDHMFMSQFNPKLGWHDHKIIPYGPISLFPAASVLHYGQSIFEGMKAFSHQSGKIALFRPDKNYQRFLKGAEAVCLEVPPLELFLEAIKAIVTVDKRWVPSSPDTALYIRPFLFGSESFLGVRPAKEYTFMVILSPSGSYYAEGAKPVNIWIEDEYVRATIGGLGDVKAGANYAASLRASVKAKEKGYSQVLWLDANHEYIEEVGTMNVFFVMKDEIITPKLSGSILDGVTRDSVITLLKDRGHKIIERKISVQELVSSIEKNLLMEAFGTGTAAVISPIGNFFYKNKNFKVGSGETGKISQEIKSEIYNIQRGIHLDKHGWTQLID